MKVGLDDDAAGLPALPAHVRLGARRRWEGEPGPPPPLARVAAWAYAAVGVLLLVYTAAGDPYLPSTVLAFGPIALYCFGLSHGAARLRSAPGRRPASRWICVSLLLHAMAGAAGAVTLLLERYDVALHGAWDYAGFAAICGMFFGCAFVLPPAIFARRGAPLCLSALGGTLWLFVLIAWFGP